MIKPPVRTPLFNFPMLFKVVGMLLIIESLFLLVPLVTALIYGESDLVPVGVTTIGTFCTGLALARGIRPAYSRMSKRDGFLLTSAVWIAFSLFGMLPFIFSETTPCSVSDAFSKRCQASLQPELPLLEINPA